MRSVASPFYSRNYGGFSREQIQFLRRYSETGRLRPVLDPMSGQAHYLSELAWRGNEVWLGDINPGPLLLAALRDPLLVLQAEKLRPSVLRRLGRKAPSMID